MDRLRLLGAAGGAVFAVALAVAFAIAKGPSFAGGKDVVDYYMAHGDAAIWQAVIAGFGLLCFVWFAAVFSGVSPFGPAVLVSASVVAAHMALFMNAAFAGATAALTAPVPWRRLGLVGIGLTAVLVIDAPLQILGTADWTDAVGVVAFLALLAWIVALSAVLVAALRRAPVAVPPASAPL